MAMNIQQITSWCGPAWVSCPSRTACPRLQQTSNNDSISTNSSVKIPQNSQTNTNHSWPMH